MSAMESSFKSSLPPRKRAKTEEEKEQRRVERILRNRRAAHASREKKRKHVEYLEAYVLALEDSMSTLKSNFDAVCALATPDKVAALNLPKLEDLSELRDRIHGKLSTCGLVHSESPCPEADDDLVHKTPVCVKQEPVDDEPAAAPSGYYSYLSPMQSPVNSPINLTLKSADSASESDSGPATPEMSRMASDGLIIGPATSGIDFTAQNSEAILSPRVLVA